jgi:hypothetical protein
LRGQLLRPRLFIPERVIKELDAFVDICPVEISGFGLVQRTGPETFLLYHVYIVDQEAGPAHTDVDLLALNRSDDILAEQGAYQDRILQWHSHVDFAAYFSGVDARNIRRRREALLISLVVNKAGELAARLDVRVNGMLQQRQRPVSVIVLRDRDPGAMAQAERKITEHVRIVEDPSASRRSRFLGKKD